MNYLKTAQLSILLLLFCINSSIAQNTQKLNVEEATVFLSGAQIVSTAKVGITKGENEITFTNVAGNINNQSLSVNASDGVIVESATFQNNYLLNDNLSHKAKGLKDSIETVVLQKQQVATKISVLAEQISVLQENRKVSGNASGLSVTELGKLLDLINSKMELILNEKNREENLQKKMDETIVKLNKQLDEERKKDVPPGGQLVIKFYAETATKSAITISYNVTNAGWTPIYDVRVDAINQPVKLYYKANVYQNSGIKWDNVRLSLSSGNPNEGAQAPIISPWYLSFYVAQQPYYNNNIPSQAFAKPRAEKHLKSANAGQNMKEVALDESSINNYVNVDNSGINTNFDIDLPYTIPSDGQKHLVAIKKYDVPATYRYFAVPKIDKDVFLQAQITNWEDLNLLPGTSNIFYEGTYVGQGTIDIKNTVDTMTISLGRDKKVVIKRERNKKLRSVKTVGTNIRETFEYSILTRNTRKDNINLIIQDQLPVSNDKDIEMEEKNTGDAEYDETTGLLKWTLNLKANESKNLNFGFTVKYPKGKRIDNLPK